MTHTQSSMHRYLGGIGLWRCLADASGIQPDVPAVDAAGLGIFGHGRWAFRDIDLRLLPGSVLTLAGQAGSGRSSLLLTLAGHMRPTDGRLAVFGYDIPGCARRVHHLVSVAGTGDAVLAPNLTVSESVEERALVEMVDRGVAGDRFRQACELVDLNVHRQAMAQELAPVERTLLALALALVRAPLLVVIDDVDAGLSAGDEHNVWQAIRAVADTGVTVAAATTDPFPADGCFDVSLTLGPLDRVTQPAGRAVKHRGEGHHPAPGQQAGEGIAGRSPGTSSSVA
jgi:ABC-2 type transport system ATP-binding protein